MSVPVHRHVVPEQKEEPSRRVYARPAVVCELRLETRAGSPLGVDPLFDPLSDFFPKG